MDVRATIRLRSTSAGRPAASAAEAAAHLLRELGFEVLRLGRFGVSVQAAPETFHQALGVEVRPGMRVVTEVHPKLPELANLVDLIEVAPPPVHFGQPSRARSA